MSDFSLGTCPRDSLVDDDGRRKRDFDSIRCKRTWPVRLGGENLLKIHKTNSRLFSFVTAHLFHPPTIDCPLFFH